MHWVDLIYYPSLVARLEDLDRRLDVLSEQIRLEPCDFDDLLAEQEEIIGEGFFHLQHYFIQRKGRARNAYVHGPRVGRYALAAVINAAANYWKHVGEWPDELPEPNPRRNRD
jgi:hypothetical protein